MQDYICVACGKEAEEGFCLGRLCYHCIEEVVIYTKKQIDEEKGKQKTFNLKRKGVRKCL
ncbi:TPA: hypothetical protein SA741_005486 [Bacillus cereus]|uniref:hypothetical protein n=1 Tax=Priestia endophytica TaxID=135735 RepID=UPI00296369D3|nr:hypothetical protein [Bacillus thuringiensis]HEF7293011.1 hypothetical protein [Bacillus cereus]